MCAKTIYEYPIEMDRFLIAPGSIDEYLDFEAIFGNKNPVEIEIGSGKGRFILIESLKRPDVNFIAIERSQKFLRIGLLRAAKNPRPNLQFLCWNADFILKLLLRPKTVQAYHVYFPDPWPKGRHQKRRLFNPRLIEKMSETLIDDGVLRLRTDHEEYFEDTHARILDSNLFELVEEDVSQEALQNFEDAEEAATHYEIKWRKEFRKIFSVRYKVSRQ